MTSSVVRAPSTASRAAFPGCWSPAPPSRARELVTRTTIEGTGAALFANAIVGSALVVVSGSTITNNAGSHQINGAAAAVRSMGNNHIAENTSSVGTLTFGALQ